MTVIISCRMAKPTVPFQAGSPILVSGPTHCGKTFWVSKLLVNEMFTEPVTSVLYCYGVYQEYFDQMKSDEFLAGKIRFMKGYQQKKK